MQFSSVGHWQLERHQETEKSQEQNLKSSLNCFTFTESKRQTKRQTDREQGEREAEREKKRQGATERGEAVAQRRFIVPGAKEEFQPPAFPFLFDKQQTFPRGSRLFWSYFLLFRPHNLAIIDSENQTYVNLPSTFSPIF